MCVEEEEEEDDAVLFSLEALVELEREGENIEEGEGKISHIQSYTPHIN